MNTNKFVVDKDSAIVSLDNLKFSNPPPTYGSIVSYNKVRLGPEFTTTPDQNIFSFNIAPNSDVMIDMRSFKIHSKFKFLKTDGSNLSVGDITETPTGGGAPTVDEMNPSYIAPIQNLGLALFSACRLMYRTASLVEIPNNMHKINLALAKIEKNDEDYATTHARVFHFKEDRSKVNSSKCPAFRTRFELICNGQVNEIVTPLEHNMFDCPQFMSGMHAMHLTLQRTPLRELVENYMPAGSAAQKAAALANLDKFKMELTECTLEYTEYSLSASAMEAIRSKYMKPDTPMKYPVVKGSLQIHPIVAQTMEAPNINLGVNRVPRSILVWAYSREDYNGNPKSTLNKIKHFHIESIRVKCDGRLIPQNPIKGKYTAGASSHSLYEQLLETLDYQKIPKITYEQFRYGGSAIFGIQCGQVPSQYDTQFSKSEDLKTYALHSNSNLQLDVRFGQALPEDIVLCIYLKTEHQYNLYLPNCLISVDSSAA